MVPFHVNAYAYTWNGSFGMEPEVGKFYELEPFYDNQGPDHDLGDRCMKKREPFTDSLYVL